MQMVGPRKWCHQSSILRLVEQCRNTRELKQIHSQIITLPDLSTSDRYFILSRLLFLCTTSAWASLSYAAGVFRLIHNPNLFVYNAMIRAYATKIDDSNGPSFRPALILYKNMLSNAILPDCITLPFLLKECVRTLDCFTGRSIHAHVIRFGLDHGVFVQNSLISLYSECGFQKSACKMFDEMSNKDVVSWNTVIIGFLRSGKLDKGLDLFRKMNERNVITWNTLITGFVQGGRPKEAIEFFHEMQNLNKGITSPDKITIASVVAACASLGAIDHGKWVHMYLKRSGLDCDMVIRTALIDMYGKCGCLKESVEIFKEMPEKDVLAWTAMISVFAVHGHWREAFDLFEEMEELGVRPNRVTFLGLLSACAHAGLVEKGQTIFQTMRKFYFEPQLQHYASMVDMLSRASLFDEAEELIRSMPMEPDVYVWGALLGGCQMHGNVVLGEKVARYLIDLEPLNHAFYINLCDMYAKAGRFDDVKRIRAFMDDKGIKKEEPGCSMVEVDGVVHEFSVRGSPKVVMEEVIFVLHSLSAEIKIKRDTKYN